MIKKVPFSHIFILLILSSAIDAQSSLSPPSAAVASPNYNTSSPNKIPPWDPFILGLICLFLFLGWFSVYLRANAATAEGPQPQGIGPQLLNTFPILQGSAVKQLKFRSATPSECAVCLTEFDHSDKLRLLPICNNVFHSHCIDIWLASHVTCPVCRMELKPAEERAGHHRGGNEVVIVIPNEVLNLQGHVLNESSVSGMEVDSGDRRSFGRCHSTGHLVVLGEIGMRNTPDTYDLIGSEEERRQITVYH